MRPYYFFSLSAAAEVLYVTVFTTIWRTSFVPLPTGAAKQETSVFVREPLPIGHKSSIGATPGIESKLAVENNVSLLDSASLLAVDCDSNHNSVCLTAVNPWTENNTDQRFTTTKIETGAEFTVTSLSEQFVHIQPYPPVTVPSGNLGEEVVEGGKDQNEMRISENRAEEEQSDVQRKYGDFDREYGDDSDGNPYRDPDGDQLEEHTATFPSSVLLDGNTKNTNVNESALPPPPLSSISELISAALPLLSLKSLTTVQPYRLTTHQTHSELDADSGDASELSDLVFSLELPLFDEHTPNGGFFSEFSNFASFSKFSSPLATPNAPPPFTIPPSDFLILDVHQFSPLEFQPASSIADFPILLVTPTPVSEWCKSRSQPTVTQNYMATANGTRQFYKYPARVTFSERAPHFISDSPSISLTVQLTLLSWPVLVLLL